MTTNVFEVDVIIVGAGMVGLTLANLLASQDKNIAVVDRVEPANYLSDQDYNARVTAVSPGSKAIFEHVNAWNPMQDKRVSAFEVMTVWDEASDAKINFLAQEINQVSLGYIVENNVIQSSLYEMLQPQKNVDWLMHKIIKQVVTHDEHIEVTLNDGQTLMAKLLVGADGARSSVRNIAEISFTEKSYQQKGIVALVNCELPHQKTAWQRFLSTGPLALLPLGNSQENINLCSIVWSARDDYADELLNMNTSDFERAITKASDSQLGKISLASKRASFPLHSGFTDKMVKPRIALVGDAAHALHPLAGQGANLGFTDAAVLAEVLDTERDLGSYKLLRKYERARAGETQVMQNAMDLFVNIFASTSMPLITARNYALNAANQIQPIKKFFMAHAMGLNKDRPLFAR